MMSSEDEMRHGPVEQGAVIRPGYERCQIGSEGRGVLGCPRGTKWGLIVGYGAW